MASNLRAMASNQLAMESNLRPKASNLMARGLRGCCCFETNPLLRITALLGCFLVWGQDTQRFRCGQLKTENTALLAQALKTDDALGEGVEAVRRMFLAHPTACELGLEPNIQTRALPLE